MTSSTLKTQELFYTAAIQAGVAGGSVLCGTVAVVSEVKYDVLSEVFILLVLYSAVRCSTKLNSTRWWLWPGAAGQLQRRVVLWSGSRGWQVSAEAMAVV